MKTYLPDWLRNEILDGLSKLTTLSLERQPASDVIDVTAGTWMEAICHGREWSQSHDTMRVRQCFRLLAANCNSWPTPRQFLDQLPARVSPKAIPALESAEERQRREESHERVKTLIADFAKQLKVSP